MATAVKKPLAELFSDLSLITDLPKRIGIVWDSLLIHLGLTSVNIDHINHNHRQLEDKIKDGLVSWNRQKMHIPCSKRAAEFIEALRAEEMVPLAEELEDEYNFDEPEIVESTPGFTEDPRDTSAEASGDSIMNSMDRPKHDRSDLTVNRPDINENFPLRKYQKEIAQDGLKGENSIIWAGTGSGKTRVAVYIMKNHLDNKPTGKIAFFNTTLTLLDQQYEVIRKFLPTYKIMKFSGANQNEDTLLSNTQHFRVCVLTPMTLKKYLAEETVSLDMFSMLVFDECHHIRKNEPYNQIMKYYRKLLQDSTVKRPQIIGLTASVGTERACTVDDAEKSILDLMARMNVHKIATPRINREEYTQFVPKPQKHSEVMTDRTTDPMRDTIEDAMGRLEGWLRTKLCGLDKNVHTLLGEIPGNMRMEQQYQSWLSRLKSTLPLSKELTPETKHHAIEIAEHLTIYQTALRVNQTLCMRDVLEHLYHSSLKYNITEGGKKNAVVKSNSSRNNTDEDNTGSDNTGVDNTGVDNTDKDNTGGDNTVEGNTGRDNTDKDNTGVDNTDKDNTGGDNTDKDNTGIDNTDKDNTGRDNTGKDNTGRDNADKDNTGIDNTDKDNTDKDNTGRDNTDKDNTGCDDTGVDNTGGDNTDKDNTDKDNTDKDNTDKDNTGVDNTGVDNTDKYNTGEDITENDNKDVEESENDKTENKVVNLYKNVTMKLELISKNDEYENPNIVRLQKMVDKNFEEKGKDSTFIVFVEQRKSAVAVSKYLREKSYFAKCCFLISAQSTPACDGKQSQAEHNRVVQKLLSKQINGLVATQVAEEGLDIPACNFVIRYNKSSNEISTIQAAGRSRAMNGTITDFADQRKHRQEQENVMKLTLMYQALEKILGRSFDEIRQEVSNRLVSITKIETEEERSIVAGRKNKTHGNVTLLCGNCQKVAVSSRDIRCYNSTNYIVVGRDFYQNAQRRQLEKKVKDYHNMTPTYKVHCKYCDHDWGTVNCMQTCLFAVLKNKHFVVDVNTEKKNCYVSWSALRHTVQTMTEEDFSSLAALEKLIENAPDN